MFKLVAIALCLFNLNWARAWECNRNPHEVAKGFKVVCALEIGDERLELISAKAGCEFPDGNPVDCAYAVSCVQDKSARRGSIILRKGSSFEDFCLSISSDKPNSERIMVQSKSGKGQVRLKCPVKIPLQLELVIADQKRPCSFSF